MTSPGVSQHPLGMTPSDLEAWVHQPAEPQPDFHDWPQPFLDEYIEALIAGRVPRPRQEERQWRLRPCHKCRRSEADIPCRECEDMLQ